MQGYTYFFLFLLQNIDCGYSLEPPRQNIKIFLLKFFFFFIAIKYRCILHGHNEKYHCRHALADNSVEDIGNRKHLKC